MEKKNVFASKAGMIAATVGSAVGLGNVWRFPAEVQQGGGAAFLLVYVACVIILGIPVMVAEFALGRAGGSDAVTSFKNLGARKPWWFVGGLAVLASYLILCFYMVVAGWALEYLWNSLNGSLYDIPSGVRLSDYFAAAMTEATASPVRPIIFTLIVIFLNLGVLLAGVTKGIERLSNILMPMLVVILIALLVVSLNLPDASKGLEFFLNPDFSSISATTVLNALGQAFFSLSLGMGILITYASYFPRDAKLMRTSVTVSLLDMMVAVMMGLIIFPAVTSFGLAGESLKGATLVFVTLPEVFARMQFSAFWSVMFFTLLTVAALTSTISIAEVSVAFVRDRIGLRRRYACLIVLLPLLVFSSLCSLSLNPDSTFIIAGMPLFDFLDAVATNIFLPVVSILLCIYVGWVAPKSLLKHQLNNDGTIRSRLFVPCLFAIRFIAPVLIFMVLLNYFISL